MEINKLNKGYILPSASFSLPRREIKGYIQNNKQPSVGDIVYGSVISLGQHSSLENGFGRIHNIHIGSKAIFVYGNRYAPDAYEGLIPENYQEEVDLLARSGIIGNVITRSSKVVEPTRVKILGQVCNSEGQVLNTKNYPAITVKKTEKNKSRSKMIIVVGTAMNSGKSMAGAAICWALNSQGYKVRGSKVTGTASLKDILHMNDAGAEKYSDFSYLGYPSTYMLEKDEITDIFNKLDLKYANNKENYWVVELADGIMQRETAMLLNCKDVRSRIHKLIFCAADAFGAIGGINILKSSLDLKPNAISGICSSSPLHVEELKKVTSIPVFNSMRPNAKELLEILK